MSISIIDYGLGNLLSVARAFMHFGAEVRFVQTAEEILAADRLVLPGVGAFAKGIQGLRDANLIQPIQEATKKGTPFLGICLGMQLMLSRSLEFGTYEGLNLIEGEVRPIPKEGATGVTHRIPHIGWSELETYDKEDKILQGMYSKPYLYFVHSYMAVPSDKKQSIANTDYNGISISAIIRTDNAYGCQFHPEKSGEIGLKLIDNFIKL